jgi:hypothetical protein
LWKAQFRNPDSPKTPQKTRTSRLRSPLGSFIQRHRIYIPLSNPFEKLVNMENTRFGSWISRSWAAVSQRGRRGANEHAGSRSDLKQDLFRHSPLPGDQYIRLLSIAQDETEFISITLYTFPLEQLPDYEALSYTWGKAICTQNVA